MPEVLEIEAAGGEGAWVEEDFLAILRQRNAVGMVIEHGSSVIGYMIYELHKDSLHLLKLAVHPQWRRLGVGAEMTTKLVSKLSSHRRTKIFLSVRETNLAAQLFFRQQRFKATAIQQGLFVDTGEAGYVMERSL